ncbi:efflux RND transporter permease subunit [Ruminococcaceae bacterium OttesenSCG-928-D13]|nr:efflux RND transporter permease subunit [Ruminococcaceae bacterium OttesenSCG-928-D13]
MSSFSVRKPLTVFVAVIAIIVLGVVAFTNMTPDLLPNLDLPYVVVVTPYPGSTPEKTEQSVTKPLEQAMASLENIVNINSSSSANASTIILEFNEDVNMDTVTVDILQAVQQVEGGWDDMVGSPVIMKINPSMLPVMVAAVEMEGMDTVELSTLMKNDLTNKLEGIDGVASVNVSGVISEEVRVVLSQTRLDELNRKIEKAILKQFEEPEQELEDAKKELENTGGSVSLGGLGGDTAASTDGLADMAGSLQDGLADAKKEIESQLKSLKSQRKQLNEGIQQLTAAKEGLAELEAAIAGLSVLESTYSALAAEYTPMYVNAQVAATAAGQSWDQLTDEEKLVYLAAQDAGAFYATKAVADVQMAMLGMDNFVPGDAADPSAYLVTLGALGTARATAEATLATTYDMVAAILDQMGYPVTRDAAGKVDSASLHSQLDAALADLASAKQTLKATIDGLEQLLEMINQGSVGISDVANQMEGLLDFDMSGLADMANMMVDAQVQSGLSQVESGLKQLETAKESALKQANLHNILTLSTLSQLLTAQNFSMPAGYVSDDGTDILVSVGDDIDSVEALADVILIDLGLDGLDPVHLSDVADVYMEDDREDVYAKINGSDGVLLTFSKQSTYATATVSDNIRARFEQLSGEYEGLHFYNLMDQGDYIYLVVNSIIENLLWGALFAIIILFLFLKDIRPTFITLCSIPISVIFAIALMYFSGVTINIISMSGLAVAVGMLVDNSVVVIENVFRLRALGASPVKAAVSGATQVAGAIISSTLTTVCVFLPIVFVEGLTRQLFTDLALTLGYSLVASLIVALTLVPAMSSGMMKGYKEKESKLLDRLLVFYRKTLKGALNHKVLVLAGSVVLLVASVALVLMRGFTFMPSMEMGQLTVSVSMDKEATREETVEMTDEVVRRISAIEGVETTGAMLNSGGGLMGGMMGGGGGSGSAIYVLLDESHQTNSGAVAQAINDATADLDAEVSASASSGMSLDALSGSGVSVDLYGNDLDQLQDTAKDLAKVLESLDGVSGVSDGIGEVSPELRFVVNKDKAMAHGLTTAQVYMEITQALATEQSATSIMMENNEYDVIVVKSGDTARTSQFIRDYSFTVTGQDGEEETVWLRNIADIVEGESKTSISRHNQRRTLTVTATIAAGDNVTLVANDIQRAMDAYDLPAGMSYEYSGENESILEAFEQLVQMLLLGVLLVYLIMVAQFQSLKSPFIVMFTIPLAFTGGFLALLIVGMELSVISLIGFVMLVGIVVNNGIVLVDYINQLRLEGAGRRDAIEEAGVTRMRPILMTSITTILGLIVMALGVGMGAELMQPIAITCIGGLLYATIMTLYVVPVMYDIFNKKELRKLDEEDLEITDE